MIIKASKIESVNDFLDCALFKIPYVSVDAAYLINSKDSGFGAIISKIPSVCSKIVVDADLEEHVEQALCLCNPQVLQIHCDIAPAKVKKYQKNYEVWKRVSSVDEAKKYKNCNGFVVDYANIKTWRGCSDLLSDKKIVIPRTEKDQMIPVREIFGNCNVVADVNYYNKEVYDFSQNHNYVVYDDASIDCV